MRALGIVAAALLPGCHIASTLCRPCEGGGCGAGLECVRGLCVPPSQPAACPSNRCGSEPPCGDGFECYEGRCRTPAEIELGYGHACVRWPSGAVSCWGENASGQLGRPKSAVEKPALVEGIGDAVQIAVARASTCVLLRGGQAKCFGANARGQLGAFRFRNGQIDFEDSAVPLDVFLDRPLRSIRAGELGFCGIFDDGSLACWGSGQSGCLVGGPSVIAAPLPIRIAPGPFDEVVLGTSHALARAGARVFGFGSNERGQLGAGGRLVCPPVDLGAEGVEGMAGGSSHTCLLSGGAARCLGWNDFGQTQEGAVAWPEPFTTLRARFNSSCGLTAQGIVCWGDPRLGLLGRFDPAWELRGPPTLIEGTRGASAWTLGLQGTVCFVREGDGTYCFGNHAEGQLGDGGSSSEPQQEVRAGDFTAFALGSGFSCGLERDGTVICWGDDYLGQLGRGSGVYGLAPGAVPGLRAKKVAAGFNFACAIDLEGAVWCWGRYDEQRHEGRLGGVYRGPIQRLPARVGGLSRPAVELVASQRFACAQDDHGAVACWGDNYDGHGGRFFPSREPVVITEAIPVDLPREARLLDAGNEYACAQVGDAVRCFGYARSVGAETQVGPFVQFTSGSGYNCVLRASGTVDCWGENNRAQLAPPPTADPRPLSPIPGLAEIVALDSFYLHTCALTRAGEVLCWGEDLYDGRLGLGRVGNQPRPQRVPGIPRMTAVATGRANTCAIDEEGDAWCWGDDSRGAVTGRARITLVPRRIEGLRGPRDRD